MHRAGVDWASDSQIHPLLLSVRLPAKNPLGLDSRCSPQFESESLKRRIRLVDPEKVIFRHMKWSIGSIRALQSE